MTTESYYKAITERTEMLKRVLPKLKHMIDSAPAGTVRKHSNKHGTFWGVTEKDSEGKLHERYLKPGTRRFSAVINRFCALKLYPLYSKEYRYLCKLTELDPEGAETAAKEKLWQFAGEYIRAEFQPLAVQAEKWGQESYLRLEMDIQPSSRFETKRGETVRSKLECIAVDTVYSMGLPYRLDALLSLPKSGGEKYPDITIMSPFTGKIIYIELFGMMSIPEYAKSAFEKINLYTHNGLMIGDNFLPVFEYPDVPFDRRAFVENLNRMLMA